MFYGEAVNVLSHRITIGVQCYPDAKAYEKKGNGMKDPSKRYATESDERPFVPMSKQEILAGVTRERHMHSTTDLYPMSPFYALAIVYSDDVLKTISEQELNDMVFLVRWQCDIDEHGRFPL